MAATFVLVPSAPSDPAVKASFIKSNSDFSESHSCIHLARDIGSFYLNLEAGRLLRSERVTVIIGSKHLFSYDLEECAS
jgi:hypothetical protein